MRVCVLNGSPKGKYSITVHTPLYLQKRFEADEFVFLNVGQKIKAYEKDLTEVITAIKECDLVLFSYPVYTFIAPYQLHRMIELLKESGEDFSGKFAAQISTSKHFYDVTAHAYIKENCFDMGFKYVGGLSADMDDLPTKKGREDAEKFWQYVRFCVKEGVYEKAFDREPKQIPDYIPSLKEVEKSEEIDTVIVTNMECGDRNLKGMIEDFIRIYPHKTRVINIFEYPFKGGCLGCFNCAGDGVCVYKDGFDSFLREQINSAKATVFAFSIKDHSMGASFKLYDDRQFCNGHRTVTMGKPIGYIVNGDLDAEANLRTIIEGRCDVGHNFLAGIATDCEGIERMAKRLSYSAKNSLVLPQSFYGVGGLKIFRDLIYLMRGMMKADHRFYKKHGFYDFPQKKLGTVIKMKLVGGLITNKKIKAKLGNKMNEGMIAPYKKVLDNLDKNK